LCFRCRFDSKLELRANALTEQFEWIYVVGKLSVKTGLNEAADAVDIAWVGEQQAAVAEVTLVTRKEVLVTHLRKRMLEDLQHRNYSEGTTQAYLQAVQQCAVHFGKSLDNLGPDDLRSYQAYLLAERKLAVASVMAGAAALRFFSIRTLERRDFRDVAYPKPHRRCQRC
jgi:hypothetical protein